MRLFLAIELPDAVRQKLSRIRDQIRSSISNASFTRDENLHITLKFLGEVDPNRLDLLVESLEQIRIANAIAIHSDHLECFPRRGPIRIVAAGFDGELIALASLHWSVEQRCAHLGFESDKRAYHPHVTLARARPTLPSRVRDELQKMLSGEFPSSPMRVTEFVLMQSHLSDKGSIYEVLHRFRSKESDEK